MNLDRYADIIENELIFVRKYVRDIPYPLITAFYREFEGLTEDEIRNRQHELYDMYSLSLSSNSLAIELAVASEAEIIFKPESYTVTPNGEVLFMTRGGAIIRSHISVLGDTRNEIENAISNWMYAVVTKPKSKFKHSNRKHFVVDAAELVPLTYNYDYESARRILTKYDITPIEAILLAFGVIPTPKTIRLYLPRVLSLFYYDGMPIHTIQLTNTDSGKSYFAMRCEFTFNFTAFSEFPSPAKLIYDARTASKGAVFTSEGIVIDEIDKLSKQRFEDSYQPLNTGLENGIWRRGVQTSSGINLEGYRLIPFILFGNILQGDSPLFVPNENPREIVTNLIEQITGMAVYSFTERFSIIDVLYEKIPITDFVVRKEGAYGSMRDSVLRAMIKLIENSVKTKYVDGQGIVSGRLRRHAEGVFNVMNALFDTEFDEKDILKLVAGEITLDDLFRTRDSTLLDKTSSETEFEEIVIDIKGGDFT